MQGMNAVGKLVGVFLLVVVASLLMAIPVHADDDSCHQVNADGMGHAVEGPCGFEACTVATISNDSLLQGSTVAGFDFIDLENDPLDAVRFAGFIEFTTNDDDDDDDKSTLTVDFTELSPGFFNFLTGKFSASGDVTDATGELDFIGDQFPDGSFKEVVTGTICFDDDDDD